MSINISCSQPIIQTTVSVGKGKTQTNTSISLKAV